MIHMIAKNAGQRMKLFVQISLMFVLLPVSAACSNNNAVDFYTKELKGMAAKKGTVLGRTGDVVVGETDFFYAMSDTAVLSSDDLKAMEPGVRKLTIKKELLRRAVVASGIREGLYSDREAAEFLVPRLERLLEEYYYYKKGGYADIERKTERAMPDDAALKELAEKDPGVKKAGAGVHELTRERARVSRRIAEQRFLEQRRKVIEDFVKTHPLEVRE
jgi:hypothetical protein